MYLLFWCEQPRDYDDVDRKVRGHFMSFHLNFSLISRHLAKEQTKVEWGADDDLILRT